MHIIEVQKIENKGILVQCVCSGLGEGIRVQDVLQLRWHRRLALDID